MAAIPGTVVRGGISRSNADYYRYGQATWKWWRRQNDASFVLLDKPLGGEAFSGLPPTIQRWLAPELLRREFGPRVEIALVDADTMIRWDAPNPFDEAAGRLSGVRDGNARWIDRGIKAFQRFFPDVYLPWWEYFNAGMVIMSGSHAGVMTRFAQFVLERWTELFRVMTSEDVGTDQPLLNRYLRKEGESIHFLPASFNMLHCVNLNPWEAVLALSCDEERERVFSSDWLYDFVDLAYVWHFTNVLAAMPQFEDRSRWPSHFRLRLSQFWGRTSTDGAPEHRTRLRRG